jgi:hypothetical protein
MGSCKHFFLDWPETTISLISGSQAARIINMSHRHPAYVMILNNLLVGRHSFICHMLWFQSLLLNSWKSLWTCSVDWCIILPFSVRDSWIISFSYASYFIFPFPYAYEICDVYI